MLKRRVQLSVDASELSTLADLTAYIEPKTSLSFVNDDASWPLSDRICLVYRVLRHAPVGDHRHARVSRYVLVRGWQALHLRLAVRHLTLWPPIDLSFIRKSAARLRLCSPSGVSLSVSLSLDVFLSSMLMSLVAAARGQSFESAVTANVNILFLFVKWSSYFPFYRFHCHKYIISVLRCLCVNRIVGLRWMSSWRIVTCLLLTLLRW